MIDGWHTDVRTLRPGAVFFDDDGWHWLVSATEPLPDGGIKVTATDAVGRTRTFAYRAGVHVRACACCTKVEGASS